MRRSWILAPITTLALTLAACDTHIGEPIAFEHAAVDGLTLFEAAPQRVVGEFRSEGNTLAFEASRVKDAITLRLTGNDGRPLVSVDTLGSEYVLAYLGTRLVMRADRDALAAAASSDDPEAQLEGIEIDGEISVLDEMLQLPELAQLPWLSRALGEQGLTGYEYPATLALHRMARKTADGLGIEVPGLANETEAVSKCQDLRSDPYGNGCYGMCGSGCGCWGWVCGDCCYHNGCAWHDYWCRTGQWYYCYNITAVIAMFGC